jgi:pantothenate kinase type III
MKHTAHNTKDYVMDIGNTRVKLYNRKEGVVHIINKEEYISKRVLPKFLKNTTRVVYSSVSMDKESLITELSNNGIECLKLERSMLDDCGVGLSKLANTTGLDRIIGVIGILSKLKDKSKGYITIDCGTAMTVNIVNPELEFIGGAIMGGLQTQLNSLHEHTDKLPHLTVKSFEEYYGNTTETAIRAGNIIGSVGSVKHIIERYEYEHRVSNVPIVVTGGDGELLSAQLGKFRKVEYNPTLVLEGIWEIANRKGLLKE